MPPVAVALASSITPFLVAAFGISSAAAAGFAFTAISIAGNIALSIGLGLASAAIQRSQARSFSDGLNTPEIRLSTRQEVPDQRKVYGEVLVGGALFWEESIVDKYYQGFLISNGPIDSFREVRNTQELLTLGTLSFNTILTPTTNIDGRPPYVGKLRCSLRQGLITQPIDPLLFDAFPALDPATFLQRGVATLVFEAQFGADFEEHQLLWGSAGRPNPLALMRGALVYDPREPSHVLPTNPDDPYDMEAARLTWTWTRNASLIIADYLWSSDGGRIPLASMDWQRIAASADYDDSLFATKSGELIPLHTIDGIVTAGQNPVQIIQTMLTANRGFIARSGGKVWVQSSMPVTEPRVTITDSDIVGGIELRREQPKRELVNRVRCRFIDPRQAWTTVDGPILERADLRTIDGDLYESTVELPWTADHRRAQRLQHLFLEETRLGRSINITVDVLSLGLEAGDVFRLELEEFPLANGVYRITTVVLSEAFDVLQISAAEYDHTIESSYDAATQEQDFELPALEVE